MATKQPENRSSVALAREALVLRNGAAAPLDAVPVYSHSALSHWMHGLCRAGFRVCAFFAVPSAVLERAGEPAGPEELGRRDAHPAPTDPREGFRLFALLAENNRDRILCAAADVGKSFPSLTPRLPEVHLFEREMHEKHGLVPEGHPWLKPVRFSRLDGPAVGDMEFFQVAGDEVHEVAVGPIHAGVIECGHFRFQCLGEVVMHLEISLGYHHRGLERLLRGGPHPRTPHLMEALSGDATIAHTWAHCTIIEALTDTEPSPRGQLIRALALELERLANHTGDLGAIAGDVGFLSTLSFCGRLRGDWLNMSALVCGSRFGRGLLAPGGVRHDLDHALVLTLKERLTRTFRDVMGAVRLIWESPSVMARLAGIGAVDPETAASLGMVGPAARASGLPRDVRHSHPLPGLLTPPDRVLDTTGDVRARTSLRHREIEASVAFCQRLLADFLDEDGEDSETLLPVTRPLSAGYLAVALVEAWRGEVCHVAITDAGGRFLSGAVVDPSFHNWTGLAVALREQQISDFPLCNKSFNLSYCGHDL